MVYPLFQLLIVCFDMRSREIIEYSDANEYADQASRETEYPCHDADDVEDYGDSSGPWLTRPKTPRHYESQNTDYEQYYAYTCQERSS